jgi:hypothetical protein
MKKTVLMVLALWVSLGAGAQPTITWSAVYGGSGPDYVSGVVPYAGDFVSIGNTFSTDGFFAGYAGDGNFDLRCSLDDGSFVVLGYPQQEVAQQFAADVVAVPDGYLRLRYGSDDNTQYVYFDWVSTQPPFLLITKTLSFEDLSYELTPITMVRHDDGSFYILLKSGDQIGVIKVSATGIVVWDKRYGGSDEDWPSSMTVRPNGGVVVSGYTYSDDGDVGTNAGGADAWQFALSSDGSIEWSQVLGTDQEERYFDHILTADGGYLLVGSRAYLNSGLEYATWVVKTDADGNLEWEKELAAPGENEAYCVLQKTDTSYLLAGRTSNYSGTVPNYDGNGDVWLMELNEQGDIRWDHAFGGSEYEFPRAMMLTEEGELLVAAQSLSGDGDVPGNSGDFDIWFFLVNMDEVILSTTEPGPSSLHIFPNPVSGSVVQLDGLSEAAQIRLLDFQGRVVLETSWQSGQELLVLPDQLPRGIYALDIRQLTTGLRQVEKLVLVD